MTPAEHAELLAVVVAGLQDGSLPVEEAVARLRRAAVTQVDGIATVDHDRAARGGAPEVILCEGKEPADLGPIASAILERSDRVLATRCTPDHAAVLCALRDDAVHHARARCVTIGALPAPAGHVAVVTGGTADVPVAEEARVTAAFMGTADVPVAEEARVTAAFMGAKVDALYDVGVAGIHRILGEVERLAPARAIVVCAGMEGALASVVGGLTGVPVIAVPTQGGYGATFGGLAALLAMVNSCAANVVCAGIDDGFGAGHVAALINNSAGRR
ncbi:MAG: AIR carboxylase family protein [Planctomycetota bacterium]